MLALGKDMKQISSLLTSEILTVVVGERESKKEFSVHKDLICDCSGFFQNAMKKGMWKESDTGIISFPSDVPEVFAMYLQACYAGNLHMEKKLDSVDGDVMPLITYTKDLVIMLASVYALAERLIDAEAKATAIRAFFDLRKIFWFLGAIAREAVNIIYASTTGPCGIRQLLMDMARQPLVGRWRKQRKQFQVTLKMAPVEFLEDFACDVVAVLHDRMGCCACHNCTDNWSSLCNCQLEQAKNGDLTLSVYTDWEDVKSKSSCDGKSSVDASDLESDLTRDDE